MKVLSVVQLQALWLFHPRSSSQSTKQDHLQTGGPLAVQQCMPVHALLHPVQVLKGHLVI